jgi:16S rRNA (cytosine967-C5)-methyltransferase
VSEVSAPRATAFDVVLATFERGAFTESAFRSLADERRLAGRDRAQAQRLAFGAVQRRGTSDAAIRRLAERSPRMLDPPVAAALRLGLYELMFSDATPDHAAVDQTVELVKRAGAAHAAGFANAVLRRAARERARLGELLEDDSSAETAAVAHSVPRWLSELWWRELGAADARALLAASNRPPERALRVNTLRSTPEAAIETLADAGVRAGRPHAPAPLAAPEIVVAEGSLAGAVPMIERGELVPQSRGSAAAVELLDPRPGEQVLDLCAGPGIKSGQIAARMGDRGEVIAVEADSDRAAEVAAQAERLGLRSVTVIEADATALEPGTSFDRVLVDVPCSDLGTLAARPDARWRKSPQGIARLAELQAAILANAVRALRPGGTLVYSTCTISQRENELQVAELERSEAGAALAIEDLSRIAPHLASAVDPRCLQLRPDRDRTTGFFLARLSRHD